MPDWLMILVKCVLYALTAYLGLGAASRQARWIYKLDTEAGGLQFGLPILLAVILAALEGWIAP